MSGAVPLAIRFRDSSKSTELQRAMTFGCSSSAASLPFDFSFGQSVKQVKGQSGWFCVCPMGVERRRCNFRARCVLFWRKHRAPSTFCHVLNETIKHKKLFLALTSLLLVSAKKDLLSVSDVFLNLVTNTAQDLLKVLIIIATGITPLIVRRTRIMGRKAYKA